MLNRLREKSSLIGIFWMVVTTIFFVGVTIFVKILGEKIPSSQTAFLRYLFGTIFLLPIILNSFRDIQIKLLNKFGSLHYTSIAGKASRDFTREADA